MPGTPQAIVRRAFGACGVTVSARAEGPVLWGEAGMGLGVSWGRASGDHLRHGGFNHSQWGPLSLHKMPHPALPVPCRCPRAGLPDLSPWPLLTWHPNILPGPLQPPSTTLGPTWHRPGVQGCPEGWAVGRAPRSIAPPVTGADGSQASAATCCPPSHPLGRRMRLGDPLERSPAPACRPAPLSAVEGPSS